MTVTFINFYIFYFYIFEYLLFSFITKLNLNLTVRFLLFFSMENEMKPPQEQEDEFLLQER